MRQLIGAGTPREAVAGGYGGIFVLHAHRGHAGRTGGLAKRPDGFRRRIPHLGVRAGKSHLINGVNGGNVAAIVADEAYELGRAMAAAGARKLVGEDTPPFLVAPALTVTADTVAEGWMKSLHIEAPASLTGQ